MNSTRKLWVVLALVTIVSFIVLGVLGREVYRQAPPIPEQVRAESGAVLYTAADIMKGQQVWQSIGGHQLGSIWGHGSYVAPDWTADWLHREVLALLDRHALAEYGRDYASLDAAQRAALEAGARIEMRRNTYNPDNGVVTVSLDRSVAIQQVAAHYQSVFSDAPETARLREQYAMRNNPVPDAERREALTAFVFWSAWSAVTRAQPSLRAWLAISRSMAARGVPFRSRSARSRP